MISTSIVSVSGVAECLEATLRLAARIVGYDLVEANRSISSPGRALARFPGSDRMVAYTEVAYTEVIHE